MLWSPPVGAWNQAKLAAGANRGYMAQHEQVPALICDTYARRILCAATISGGYFAPLCMGFSCVLKVSGVLKFSCVLKYSCVLN